MLPQQQQQRFFSDPIVSVSDKVRRMRKVFVNSSIYISPPPRKLEPELASLDDSQACRIISTFSCDMV